MITKEMAAQYVLKLAQMKGFPRDSPPAFGEFVMAMGTARDESIARQVVAYFLDNAEPETPCPMPKNLREAVWAIQEPAYEAAKPPVRECEPCEDTGIVGGFVGGPRASWCECEKGRRGAASNAKGVDSLNEIYDDLMAKFGKKNAQQVLTTADKKRRAAKDDDVKQILQSLS